jgi:hypothetical protein
MTCAAVSSFTRNQKYLSPESATNFKSTKHLPRNLLSSNSKLFLHCTIRITRTPLPMGPAYWSTVLDRIVLS